jgi:glycosyltransferase involved in cell wall biosynthesis
VLLGKDIGPIALDARSLNREHLRGIGRCVWELISRGSARHGIQWELFADRPDLPLHLPPVAGLKVHQFECRGYRFHSWEQFGLPRRVSKARASLLHGPASQIPWWQPVPAIVTLHDTIPWQQDEPAWPRGWYTDRVLPRAFHKCAAIITISENSRRDIVSLWPKLADKLHVIPNGVGDAYLQTSPGPLSEILRSNGVREPYLLYFGGEIARKRLDWAIRVLDRLAEPRINLVICGVERAAHARIREQAKPELRDRLLFSPFIPEGEMPRLYQNAIAVLYPTLYEGFGLPALESQAVGTPVLFSALGSLAELQGPGAVVLPPEDLSAWVDACRNLLAARINGPVPGERARAWARQFSWDTYAARTVDVYRLVLGRSNSAGAKAET